MDGTLDRIERQIDIEASAERVWELVSEPGWYINNGTIIEHRIERSGDVDIVHDPVHGTFPIRTEKLDAPRYAAFRWLAGSSREGFREDESTLVEFWIDERPEGGVTLRVAESGFSTLPGGEEKRRKALEENTEGWNIELAAARAFLMDAATESAG
ncbi:ATPase [Arthrobacter sp. Marseille-P9274]|uniref:ATPase n=1 Tax=Arthrobacter sp. Marseille-P9274 TaxID=2866572 RepID=UPI0021C5C66E|nr:ATPase [Arthrobacter sp. Marseille-P9274]